MTRRTLLVIALTILLFGWGCNGTRTPTEPVVRPVSFETVYRSRTSGIHARRGELIFTADRWAAVWSEIHAGQDPVPPVPTVDFSTAMVVLAASGDQPDGCWNVQIANVTPNVVRVSVDVAQTHPPVGCSCPTVVVQPVHAVRATKLEAPGQFNFFQSITGSCGG